MKRILASVAVLMAVITLMLRIGTERLTRLCSPSSARSGPEFKGHPWFAATYDFVSRWSEPEFLRRFRSLVAGEATGRVLEIGVGTGANFPYYQRAGKIVAVEPDPFMLGRARRRANRLGLEVEFQQAAAEALPFPDASFDTVVATLVFCSVADQDRSLTEVKRVLRPGGTFRFLEHVRADGRLVGEAQDLLTPLWQQVGASCHLNRRTSESIEAAGFEIEELRQEGRSSLFPIVAGVARDRDGLP